MGRPKSFTLILALVLLTLVACATNDAQGSSLFVSSQSEPAPSPSSSFFQAEKESQPGSEELPTAQKDGPMKAFADELRDIYDEEFVDLLNQLLSKHRNGTFIETPNHHPPYPPDFPPANNLPEIRSINDVVIAWRETEQLDFNTEIGGGIFVIVQIDENHIYILEPAKLVDADNNISIGFGDSGFANMSIEEFIVYSKTTLAK